MKHISYNDISGLVSAVGDSIGSSEKAVHVFFCTALGFGLFLGVLLVEEPVVPYPPDKQEQATRTVLQQAELLCGDWAEEE